MRHNSFWTGMLFLLAFSLPLAAQPAGAARPNRPQRPQMRGERPMHKALNLTDEQEKKLDDMRLELQKEMIPLRAELQTKELDLQAEIKADNPNQDKINSLVDDISKVRADMQKKRIDHMLAFRKILTPEQQAIFDSHKGAFGRGFMGNGMREGARGFGPMAPGRMHQQMRQHNCWQ